MHRRDFIEGTLAAAAGGALAAGMTRGAVAAEASGAGAELTAADYEATRRFAETAFGRIAYVERGTGEAALFLHGFPLNGFQWRGVLPRLAPYRRCIAPDFLGLGYTEPAAGQGLAPAEQAGMLVALLDTLGVGSVDLVANDSGGAVAQLLVAHHPDRVRSLILTNCDVETDCPPPALLPVIELARAGRFAAEWLAPWRADKRLARSAEGIGGMCYVDPAHPTDEAIEYYFAPLVRTPEGQARANGYALALERNALEGLAPVLARSTVPTRILWGTGDPIFSAESPGYLDRTLGRSLGVRRLEGRKLFWPEELPEVIAEEALKVWAEPRRG